MLQSCVIVVSMAASIYCVSDDDRQGVQPVVMSARSTGQSSAFVVVREGVLPSAIVALRYFEPLTPGTQATQAEALLGKPARVRQVDDDTYYDYVTSLGKVSVVHRTASSTFGTASWWSLVAYPDRPLVDILDSQLLTAIKPFGDLKAITIHVPHDGRTDKISVTVEATRVTRIEWRWLE